MENSFVRMSPLQPWEQHAAHTTSQKKLSTLFVCLSIPLWQELTLGRSRYHKCHTHGQFLSHVSQFLTVQRSKISTCKKRLLMLLCSDVNFLPSVVNKTE